MKDSRVKVCIPMDPWFLPYSDQMDKVFLKDTPILSIITDTWYEWCKRASKGTFDCRVATNKFFMNSTDKGNPNLTHISLNDTTHIS
jgi:hypothetical protein